VRLQKYHDDKKLMGLEHVVMSLLKDKLIITSFMTFHGGGVVYVNVRFEDQIFEYTNHMMDKHMWRRGLDLFFHAHV